jgi:uncharacterized RmlC-like cupin family protein
MAESKAMMKKEVSFMKKKGAPASMIKHEEKEYGMKKGGAAKKYAGGGAITSAKMGAVKTAAQAAMALPPKAKPKAHKSKCPVPNHWA